MRTRSLAPAHAVLDVPRRTVAAAAVLTKSLRLTCSMSSVLSRGPRRGPDCPVASHLLWHDKRRPVTVLQQTVGPRTQVVLGAAREPFVARQELQHRPEDGGRLREVDAVRRQVAAEALDR